MSAGILFTCSEKATHLLLSRSLDPEPYPEMAAETDGVDAQTVLVSQTPHEFSCLRFLAFRTLSTVSTIL